MSVFCGLYQTKVVIRVGLSGIIFLYLGELLKSSYWNIFGI